MNSSDPIDHRRPDASQAPEQSGSARDARREPDDNRRLRSTDRHLRLVPDLGPRQLSLDYEYEVSPGVPAVPAAGRHLQLLPQPAPQESGDATPPEAPPVPAAPRSQSSSTLPPAGKWAGQLARAIGEVAAGQRPAAQLTAHVSADQLRPIARLGNVARHPSSRPRRDAGRLKGVSGVRVCAVAPGVVEASAVLLGEQRAHALAMRLEAKGGRWVATAVELR